MAMSKTINNASPKHILSVYLFLAVLTLVVFWQLKNHDFVNLDDPVYVTENAHIQSGMTLENIAWAFKTTDAEFWHPLTWLSLMLDYQLYGLKAGGFHVTSLILHILTTLLLFWVFHRMTGTLWQAAFVAAFFAIHPLHVESVAWVAERKDTLSALFWMLTLCLYVYYTEKPVIQRYLLVLLSFACGLMSKSMLVTLPFILILLDYWPLHRLREQIPVRPGKQGEETVVPQSRKNRRALKGKAKQETSSFVVQNQQAVSAVWFVPIWQIKEKAPLFLLSLAFGLITIYSQKVMTIDTWPLASRIANAFVSYMTYLVNIFYPLKLAVFYPFVEQLPVWKVLTAVLLLLMISAAVIFMIKRFPYLFVGWCWYIFTLAPVIGIIQVGKHALADRYSYLSSIGISIMLAWGMPLLFKTQDLRKKILLPVGLAFIAVMGFFAWRQCGFWVNSVTLYEHTLKVTAGNALAHYNLANVLLKQRKREEAKQHYLEAIRINPRYDDAHSNLALALVAEGKYEEAIDHNKAALKINPYNEITYSNLGSALAGARRDAEAAEQYLKAIALNPNYSDAHFNYANLLVKQDKFDEAAGYYRNAIAVNRNYAEAHYNLADILLRQGKEDEAIGHYREMVRIDPSNFRAQNNLGVQLEKQARHDEAIECYHRALRIEPDNAGAYFNLGVALGNKGDYKQAIDHFRQAIDLNPDYEPARRALKMAQAIERSPKR